MAGRKKNSIKTGAIALLMLANAWLPAAGWQGKAEAAASGPVLAATLPADDAVRVPANSRLLMTFDEGVAKGGGSAGISIRRVSDNSEWERYNSATDSRIHVEGARVSIQPGKSFTPGEAYYVLMDAGAFTNASNGAPFPGIASASEWNFTAAEPDTSSPQVAAAAPQGIGVSVFSSLQLTFGENVFPSEGSLQLVNRNTGDTVSVSAISPSVRGGGSNVLSISPPSVLMPGQEYRIDMPAGWVQDAAGNKSPSYSWSFTTGDSPISIVDRYPASRSTGVPLDAGLRLKFDKPAVSGSTAEFPKRVTLKRVADNATVKTWDSNSAGTQDGYFVLPLDSPLAGSTAYYVLADAGSYRSGELLFAGISNAAEWTFTTRPAAGQAPLISKLEPSAGGILGALDGKLRLTFDKNVYPGTGYITIRNAGNGSAAATIPVTSDLISGFGSSTVTISPGMTFAEGAAYYVEIGNQAFLDESGNRYSGLSGSSAWTFTASRDSLPPSIVTMLPANGATAVSTISPLRLVFNEPIRLSPGAKVVLHKSGSEQTYPATAAIASDNANMLLITPLSALPGNTAIYAEIGVNSVTDLAGNGFSGILNEYQWKFTTMSSGTGTPSLSSAKAVSSTRIQLEFSMELDAASVPYPASFYVTANDSPAAREIAAVEVSGNSATLVLRAPLLSGQKITVSYTVPAVGMPALQSLAANRASGFSGKEATYDEAASMLKVTGGILSGSYLTLQLNRNVQSLSPAAAAQFSLYVNDSYVRLTEASVSGSTLLLRLESPSTNGGSAYLNYSPGTSPILDLSGNGLAAFSQFYIQNMLDNTKPVLSNITAGGSTVTLAYNEGLHPGRVPGTSRFAVMNGGSSMAVGSLSIEGSKITLKLSGVINSAMPLTVSYTKSSPAVSDLAGNEADSFSGIQAYLLASGTNSGYLSSTITGDTLTLLYSGILDPSSTPVTNHYTIRYDGMVVPINSVSLSGSSVVLKMNREAAAGQAVTVSYSPPSYNPLKLQGGDAAAMLSSIPAVNATGQQPGNTTGGAQTGLPGRLELTDIIVSSDVSPAGRAASLYTVISDKLLQAFQKARNSGSGTDKVSFKVPETQKAGLLALPIPALQQALAASSSAAVELQFNSLTATIPLQGIDFAKTAKLLNAGGPTGYLLISLDENPTAILGMLQSTVSRSGLQTASGAFSMDLSVFGSSSATTERKKLSGLSKYATITVQSSASLTPLSSISTVFYDDETGMLSYLPSKINGQSIAIKAKFGGVFAIVKGTPVLSDVNGHWAKNDIVALASKSIVRGRSLSAFMPKAAVTRAEFAEYIARALGLKGDKASSTMYSDVAAGTPAASYIGAVSAAGIVQGSGGKFRPNALISRQEMAAMMIRAIEASEMKIIPPKDQAAYLASFKDKGKISGWAQPYASKAVFAGIATGQSAGMFAPLGQATRAEATVMLKRMLLYLGMIDM